MPDFFGISTLIIPRRVGSFVAQCTVEERHVDQLQITQHPVESTAAITDHAFALPAELTIELGWTNSSLLAGFDQNYVNYVYQQLLTAQKNRQPMTIVTGKRTYQNMLIQSIATRTDRKTFASLPITLRCREVILAATTTIGIPQNDKMADPAATGTTQSNGTTNLKDGSGTINRSALPPMQNIKVDAAYGQ